jgi:hypothetical protein
LTLPKRTEKREIVVISKPQLNKKIMPNNNQPLVEVKENYLIDVNSIVNFLKMSDHSNEWELYNQIFNFSAKVAKEYRAPKRRLADLHQLYLITKHRLCMLRDVMIKREEFDETCYAIRESLMQHQAEENGKPLQLSCLSMVVKESMIQPTEVHIILGGGFGMIGGFGVFSLLDELSRE